ncbi:unnamed protein product [Cylicocyclus nassatus]|uniref:Uncharacterized protein n=1 Tax=Cylicocyclus nassatus TaxID=53992 RepID=A0AA36DSH4_CYLNA|nr:unnamed protein product [Cylicocyclus nassatus]
MSQFVAYAREGERHGRLCEFPARSRWLMKTNSRYRACVQPDTYCASYGYSERQDLHCNFRDPVTICCFSNYRRALDWRITTAYTNKVNEQKMSTNGYGHGMARAASHAGSWYSSNPKELDRQISRWLDAAGERLGSARAIVSPHAGYSYCGDTAAYAFKQIAPECVDRVFVLGPSHVVCLNGCALTTCSKYRTPIGDLHIDLEVNDELRATRQFDLMDRSDEEAEHSIEMQMPFIAKIMESNPNVTVIPILVGSLTAPKQQAYGKIFANYLENPRNLFVISSDFCHWGNRFHFAPHNPNSGLPIYEQITQLDRDGMDAIETLNPQIFNDYLKRTQNTICGRNPITVLLQAAEHFRMMNNHTHEFRFLKYSQSNKARSVNDSSVSYAAGALFMHPK